MLIKAHREVNRRFRKRQKDENKNKLECLLKQREKVQKEKDNIYDKIMNKCDEVEDLKCKIRKIKYRYDCRGSYRLTYQKWYNECDNFSHGLIPPSGSPTHAWFISENDAKEYCDKLNGNSRCPTIPRERFKDLVIDDTCDGPYNYIVKRRCGRKIAKFSDLSKARDYITFKSRC